ncbi:MAG: sigma-70 family RNA polymerase sigma factor [Deltaproteobacteria bacterium]
MTDAQIFEDHRPSLLALAYRMLGDFARAEDLVQDAWLRWSRRDVEVDAPKSYLLRTVARLCLNELDSARVRRETRADQLPEPLSLEANGLMHVEAIDQLSMAFLVLLQRLTAAERAVLLLHDVFDFSHAEIAVLLGKSAPASRKLLERARVHVAEERRALVVSTEEHRRLLGAFVAAATRGDVEALSSLLAEDVVLVADAGPDGGRYGRVRNLPGPLIGVKKVAAFVAAVTAQGAEGAEVREQELNGRPGVVLMVDGVPTTALTVSVADGRVRGIFIQADASRLSRL